MKALFIGGCADGRVLETTGAEHWIWMREAFYSSRVITRDAHIEAVARYDTYRLVDFGRAFRDAGRCYIIESEAPSADDAALNALRYLIAGYYSPGDE